MTSHVIDLTQSIQFYIIMHSEVDFLLIISHLTYLTFSVKLPNQLFKSTYAINLLIELAMLLTYSTLLPQTYIHRKVYFSLLSPIWFK